MFGRKKKSSTPGIRRNAMWNCAGTLSDALIGFFMMPFVVHTLGDTTYGLWALIASMTGCFGFLDLGVRGALGRQLAFHLARRDTQNVNATLNTALALLSGACAVTLVGVTALQFLFFLLFDVPSEQEWTVRITLLLSGLNLAIIFPLSAFDATLWAAQRFDRLNQIDMTNSVLKAVLTLVFLRSPAALIWLPVINLSGFLIAGLLKMAVTWFAFDGLLESSPLSHHRRVAGGEGGLRFGIRFISRAALGDIFAFGLWNFLRSVAMLLLSRIPAVVIGAFVCPAAVTPYAIADKILTMVNTLFSAATGVLTPRSAGYSALDDSSRQRALFLQGGRLCGGMALFAGLGMCFFGRPFIATWMGSKYPQAAVYLAIIALGAIVPLSQYITGCVLLGIARHQFLAVISIGQTLLAIGLSLLAAVYSNAVTVCIAMAIVSTLAGLATAWLGCQKLQVRVLDYTREAVLPALMACVVPTVIGTAMLYSGSSIFAYEFVAQIVLYTFLFAVSFYWLCLRPLGFILGFLSQES